MNQEKENVIVTKSYAFALQMIDLYKKLIAKKEFVLSKQILRSGTSIGANIHEGVASESKRDFVHKLGITAKESRETAYWLSLLKDSNYIEQNKDFKQHYFNNKRKILSKKFIILNS